MADNNFKKIDNFEADDNLKNKTIQNTQGSIGTVKSFFEIVDLYVSKFFGVFINAMKDDSQDHRSDFSTTGLLASNPLEDFSEEEEEIEDNDQIKDGEEEDDEDTH